MNYITPLFFEFEPLQIANVTENGSTQLEVNRFIGRYEKQCLRDVLGDVLAKELNDSYEIVNNAFVFKTDATQAIKDLVQGKEYIPLAGLDDTIDWDLLWSGENCAGNIQTDQKRVWPGIVVSDSFFNGVAETTFKTSFIADFIHYHYLLAHRSITTGAGQQELSAENSTTVQNFSKRIDSWNSFCLKVSVLYRFLQDNRASYPTWKPNCNLHFQTKY
jgi:hypothetical protein